MKCERDWRWSASILVNGLHEFFHSCDSVILVQELHESRAAPREHGARISLMTWFTPEIEWMRKGTF